MKSESSGMTQNIARFRFYGALNDFLPKTRRCIRFKYPFKGNPAIKDTIEAIGVPHTEVGGIVVNGKGRDFFYQLRDKDCVCVYGNSNVSLPGNVKSLRAKPSRGSRFILDSHLGKLARYLRLLGFNTLYRKDYSDEEIVKCAQKHKRIVLTRDIGLLKNKIITHGYWVRSTDPGKQIKEVVKRFVLGKRIRPFHLCLECGGKIVRVKKDEIVRRLPAGIKEYFDKFYICLECRKIYWQGSHYEKLCRFVNSIRKIIDEA